MRTSSLTIIAALISYASLGSIPAAQAALPPGTFCSISTEALNDNNEYDICDPLCKKNIKPKELQRYTIPEGWGHNTHECKTTPHGAFCICYW